MLSAAGSNGTASRGERSSAGGEPPKRGHEDDRIVDLSGTPDVLQTALLGTFVAAINVVLVLLVLTCYRLWTRGPLDPLGLGLAVTMVVLGWLPTRYSQGPLMRGFVRMVCTKSQSYFPTTVTVEDPSAMEANKSYILALEPHSCLPLAIPMVFAPDSPLLPSFLRGSVHGLATSTCFITPFVKQLWWGLGLRPVSRSFIQKCLSSGKSVVLCPGGVQECLYMDHKSETVFLTKRLGFVRMAMQHNAPLVPVFVFGQSHTYNWWRPGPDKLVQWISRQIGFAPLAVWGRWGTPVPLRHAMHVVIGKPLVVPHVESPTTEQVAEQLCRFIDEMKALVERYKGRCGDQDLVLRVF